MAGMASSHTNKRAREGDRITALYFNWNVLKKMEFQVVLCNNGDASANVFNGINSLLFQEPAV